MTSVTFPTSLGGDGSTVTDDANATTGLGNGGHRTRFVPALAQTVAVAANTVTRAQEAAASAASALNAPGTNATSATSLTIGTGSRSFTLAQTGKAFSLGQSVIISNTASPTNWMAGAITAFNSATGAITVNVLLTNGSGTAATWTISLTAPIPSGTWPITAQTVADLAITTQKLADGAVTSAKLAADVIEMLVPAGAVQSFARSTPPSGWLAANGAAVSRTTYATLFAAIGTTFGAGDGSTTFNLPDVRDRMMIGSGSLYALGATGGSRDAIVVSHTHTGTTDAAGASSGTVESGNGTGDFGTFRGSSGNISLSGAAPNRPQGSAGGGSFYTAIINVPNHQHTFTTNATGSSGTNANLPPYIALLPCIKF